MGGFKRIRDIINEDFSKDLKEIMEEHKFGRGLTMCTVMKGIRDGKIFVGISKEKGDKIAEEIENVNKDNDDKMETNNQNNLIQQHFCNYQSKNDKEV